MGRFGRSAGPALRPENLDFENLDFNLSYKSYIAVTYLTGKFGRKKILHFVNMFMKLTWTNFQRILIRIFRAM